MIVTPVMAEYEPRQDLRRRHNTLPMLTTRQHTVGAAHPPQQHSRIYLYDSGQQQQQQQIPPQQPPPAMAEPPPVSRTYQYRKVMKPMLERKRRARINRCLDELKELMVTALQSEGENVAKLEKADILELTVQHLHKLRKAKKLALSAGPIVEADRFRAGYTHCANEVSKCLAATPGVDVRLGTKLMSHLGHRLNELDRMSPLTVRIGNSNQTVVNSNNSMDTNIYVQHTAVISSPASSPTSYSMPPTPTSSRGSDSPGLEYSGGLLKVAHSPVWRPW